MQLFWSFQLQPLSLWLLADGWSTPYVSRSLWFWLLVEFLLKEYRCVWNMQILYQSGFSETFQAQWQLQKQKIAEKTQEDWKQDPVLSSFACNWTSQKMHQSPRRGETSRNPQTDFDPLWRIPRITKSSPVKHLKMVEILGDPFHTSLIA